MVQAPLYQPYAIDSRASHATFSIITQTKINSPRTSEKEAQQAQNELRDRVSYLALRFAPYNVY